MAHVAKVGQRVEPGIAHQPDITAVAAITAVGPVLGNEALAPKADTAVPAGAGCHAYGGFIDKTHFCFLAVRPLGCGALTGVSDTQTPPWKVRGGVRPPGRKICRRAQHRPWFSRLFLLKPRGAG